MASSDASRGMERIFSVLFGIALFAVVVVVGAYALNFAGPGGYAFSKNVEDWVRFAEYLGGTLGPIYGLLAFLGVLITILLQRRQIDDMRAQSEQQALQNLLASVSANIDATLHRAPVIKPSNLFDDIRSTYEVVSVRNFLSVGGSLAMLASTGEEKPAAGEDWIQEIKKCIGADAKSLAREIDQLAKCLNEYRRARGSEAIEDFYLERYTTIVGYIVALEFQVSDEVMNRFDLAECKVRVLHEARKSLADSH